MIRKLPLVPTLIVLIAVGIMIGLGFWQIDRLHQKEAMLAQYEAVEANAGVRRWTGGNSIPPYSRGASECVKVTGASTESGQNAAHAAGWAKVAACTMVGGVNARVVLGWSNAPDVVQWAGGKLTGTYLSRGKDGAVIVADPTLACAPPEAAQT